MKNEKNEKVPVGKTAPYWMDEGFIHGIDEAPDGKKWIRNIMSNYWILEDEETPFTQSVASETYWCS
jgi:hypothetical protein